MIKIWGKNEESGTLAHPGLWSWLRPWDYSMCSLSLCWRSSDVTWDVYVSFVSWIHALWFQFPALLTRRVILAWCRWFHSLLCTLRLNEYLYTILKILTHKVTKGVPTLLNRCLKVYTTLCNIWTYQLLCKKITQVV